MKTILYLLIILAAYTGCTSKEEKTEAKTDERMANAGYIAVSGSQLKYVVQGEGQPCLVIGSSVYYPKTFSKNLRRHLKMYFVDMRWFAEEYTPVDLQTFTLDTIISDIEKVRSSLQLEKPILMGHSIHGTIAMEYAKHHPENISHVIAIGSPNIIGNEAYERATNELWATASDERKAYQQQQWEAFDDEARDSIASQELVKAYIADAARYWYDHDYDATWLWDGMTVHHELTSHLFGTIFGNYDMFDGEVDLEVPAYVAMGTYDYIISYTLWLPEKGRKNLTIELLEQSGHTPQLEEPELFDQRLLDWIDRNH